MGILAKVFTPNVDFSWSHTPRHSTLKDVLSPYPQVRSTATVKTEKHRRNGDSAIGNNSRNFQFVLSLSAPLSQLKYYNEKENRVKMRIIRVGKFEGVKYRKHTRIFFLTYQTFLNIISPRCR